MTPNLPRRLAVLVAAAAAIAVPTVQASLDLGLSQGEFAAQGNSTLRVEGYAFSIWGPIYLGLVGYAVFQLRARETATLAAFGWPSVIAASACAAWIVASSLDMQAATVLIIGVGAATAIAAVLRRPADSSRAERLLVAWPNAVLAGWLTIAAAVNLLTVLTAWGQIEPGGAATWGLAATGLVTAIGVAVAWRAREPVYLLPIAWGLIGVFIAERAGKPTLALTALGCAAGLLAFALAAALQRRSP